MFGIKRSCLTRERRTQGRMYIFVSQEKQQLVRKYLFVNPQKSYSQGQAKVRPLKDLHVATGKVCDVTWIELHSCSFPQR